MARCGTSDLEKVAFFVRIKELAQLVAAWQCSLRLSNVQSCYATLEYSLRNIYSNKFGIYSQPIFQTFGLPAHSPLLLCSNLRQPFESSRVSRSATFVKNRGRSDIRKQNFRRRCQLKREFLYLCAPKSTKTLRPHKTTHKLTPIHFGFVDLRPLSSHYFYELGRPEC